MQPETRSDDDPCAACRGAGGAAPDSRLHLFRSLLACTLLTASLLAVGACSDEPSIEDVRALHARGRYEASLEPLRTLLELRPDDPEVHYRYGVALNRTTSSPIAVWSLRKAAEDADWAVAAQLELAATHMRVGNDAQVIEAASAVLKIEPDNLDALRVRGLAYLDDPGTIDLALQDFETVLDLKPGDEAASASRAAALLMLGEVEEAERAIGELQSASESPAQQERTRAVLCTTQAVLLAEKGDPDAAEPEFEACLEEFPRSPVLIDQAVAFFDARDKRERASAILARLLELAPGSADYREALSKRLAADGDLEGAEALLREATRLPDPRTRGAAWTALTNFFVGQNDLDAAIEAYSEAIELADPPSQLALLTQADLLARAERHAEALAVAKRLERDSYRGLIEARVHLNEGRPAEALARLEEVFPTWPNNAGARYYAARAAEQLGDFARAVEEYRQSIRSAPDQTDAGVRLARLYLEAGLVQNAWTTATQNLRTHPNDAETVRIMLTAATGAEPGSVETFFSNLQGRPAWPAAVSIRTRQIEEKEGPAAALAYLKDVEALDLLQPASAEPLRLRVELALDTGDAKGARKLVEKAIAAHPDHGPFHEIRGMLLEREGASEDRIRAAHAQAVELAPRSSRALESLARAEERAGRLDEALALYRKAMAAGPYALSPGRRLARALEQAGRTDEAEQAWNEQLREHPWDTEAAQSLARLRIASGRLDDRTLELAERAVLFRAGPDAQRALIALHESRGETERADRMREAMEHQRPVRPLRVTPIEGV